ncbi:hypothetical protein PR048_028192 [Dryococelus australis]|uniref:Uncharacterized protein n=1 Tax=Dryococelus australis TaxID=614101 RepID=A0ABQ9GIJ9_9NEOP|nr:hypothetical protein PR048_028192 [Dryococelus australis]
MLVQPGISHVRLATDWPLEYRHLATMRGCGHVIRLLATHQGGSGSTPGFSHVGIATTMPLVGGFPSPLQSGASSYLSSASIGSQDLHLSRDPWLMSAAAYLVFAFEAQKHGKDKGDITTRVKCAIAAMRSVLGVHLPTALQVVTLLEKSVYRLFTINKVSTEQRRNAVAEETEDPREKPPISGIVQHDSHMRPPGGGGGYRTQLTLVDEAHSTRHGAAVAERLTCPPPPKANRVRSPAGPLPDLRKRDRAGVLDTWSALVVGFTDVDDARCVRRQLRLVPSVTVKDRHAPELYILHLHVRNLNLWASLNSRPTGNSTSGDGTVVYSRVCRPGHVCKSLLAPPSSHFLLAPDSQPAGRYETLARTTPASAGVPDRDLRPRRGASRCRRGRKKKTSRFVSFTKSRPSAARKGSYTTFVGLILKTGSRQEVSSRVDDEHDVKSKDAIFTLEVDSGTISVADRSSLNFEASRARRCPLHRSVVERALLSPTGLEPILPMVGGGSSDHRFTAAPERAFDTVCLRLHAQDVGLTYRYHAGSSPLRSVVSMDHRWNDKVRETGYPRENPPTSGVVRHDSLSRKSGSDPKRYSGKLLHESCK